MRQAAAKNFARLLGQGRKADWRPIECRRVGSTASVPGSGPGVRVHVQRKAGGPVRNLRVQEGVGAQGSSASFAGTIVAYVGVVARAERDAVQELMELGGWSSYEVMLRYGHLAADHLRDAAGRIDGTISSHARQPQTLRIV